MPMFPRYWSLIIFCRTAITFPVKHFLWPMFPKSPSLMWVLMDYDQISSILNFAAFLGVLSSFPVTRSRPLQYVSLAL